MDVKQELCDHHEGIVKTEPVLIYGQTEKNENQNVFGDKTNICGSQMNDFNPALIKYEMPKLEQGDYESEIDHERTAVKQELDNTSEVKATGFSNTKQEIFEYVQFKNESELLTSHCDIPTLKNENNEYPDYLTQSCNSKQIQLLTPLNNDSKKLSNQQPGVVCERSDEHPENPTHHQHDSPLGLTSDFCINLGHPNEKPFQCGICAKQYKYKLILENHLKVHNITLQIHTDERPLQCDICSKEFAQKYSLQQHLRIHSHEKPYKCEICSKGFNRNSSLHRHLIIHSNEKPFKCDICYKEFNLKTNLERHLIIHSDEKRFKCDICSKEFNLHFNLEKHLLTHRKPFQNHVIIHDNEKAFKDDIVSNEFNLRQQHLIVHTNEKPFKSVICSKNLIIQSNEKSFKCDICSKEFDLKYRLQRHLIIHTNEKLFKCNICSKEFKHKCSLDSHLVIHTYEKRFKSNIVIKKFNLKSRTEFLNTP